MREPEDGVSTSTATHVLFVYIKFPKSGAANRVCYLSMEYHYKRKPWHLLLLLIVAVFWIPIDANAQTSALCGDWIGVYEGTLPHPTEDRVVSADWKLYIRIKQIDGQYYVRMKTRIADESYPFWYQPECRVTSIDSNSISFSQLWCDDRGGDLGTEKGIAVGRDYQIARYKAVLTNGVLRLSGEYERTVYDRHGNIISTRCFHTNEYMKGLNLYKEDSDW